MSRYIDADAALRKLDDFYITALVQQKHDDVPEDYKKHWKGTASGINYARNTIIDTPTADAVEVVRCRDCQHYIDGKCYVSNRTNKGLYPRVNIHSRNENDYCSYGERR